MDYFERLERAKDDPYFETREREEQFVNRIVAAVESAMTKALPVYLAGCMAGLSKTAPVAPTQTPETGSDAIDWDFLGK